MILTFHIDSFVVRYMILCFIILNNVVISYIDDFLDHFPSQCQFIFLIADSI